MTDDENVVYDSGHTRVFSKLRAQLMFWCVGTMAEMGPYDHSMHA